jgi:hypothetical protein
MPAPSEDSFSHVGYFNDLAIARAVPGIEVVMSEPIGSVEVTFTNGRITEPFMAGATPTGSFAVFVVPQAFCATKGVWSPIDPAAPSR